MDTNPEWNESWYFNFYDEANDLTAFMRIGNKPNKDEKSMFFFLMGKEFTIGMRQTSSYDESKKTDIASLRFEPCGGKWKLTYDSVLVNPENPAEMHPVKMDIDWTPINEEMDYKRCVDERLAAMSSKVASEHLEQFGTAVGTLSIDGRVYSIDATGERDKSEGVRDWGSPKMWYWLNSVYDKRFGFDVTKLCTDMGDVDAGYFDDGSGNDPIVKAEIDTRYDGKIPSGYTMTATGKSGKKYDIECEVIRYALLPMADGAMMLVETISKTTWNGKTGYGIAEFLVRND